MDSYRNFKFIKVLEGQCIQQSAAPSSYSAVLNSRSNIWPQYAWYLYIQGLSGRGQIRRSKVKVRRNGGTSPLIPSSQTLSKFGYDLRDLGDSEPVGDTSPIRERSKIEEGSEEAIYVISMEDSEGPLEELWRLFAYEHEGSILIERLTV